jgi:hypothetical protein
MASDREAAFADIAGGSNTNGKKFRANARGALLEAAGVELGQYFGGGASAAGVAAGADNENEKHQKQRQKQQQQQRQQSAWGKVLILHGFRGSASSFKKKTGKLRAKLEEARLLAVYAQAPHTYELKVDGRWSWCSRCCSGGCSWCWYHW